MKAPIPSWIASKLASLAVEYQKNLGIATLEAALSELEGQAATILRAGLASWPTLADLVPPDFLNLLNLGALPEMTSLERAAMVLIEADARSVSGAINPDDLAEFTRLKWQALASLFKGAADAR